MSEHPLAAASVGTGHERRFATLAELFEFLEADVAGRSEGEEEDAETSDELTE